MKSWEPLGKKSKICAIKEWTPEIEVQVFDLPRKGGIIFNSPHRIDPSQKEKDPQRTFTYPGFELPPFPGIQSIHFNRKSPFLPGKGQPGIFASRF